MTTEDGGAPLAAGEFSTWLIEIQGAIRGEHGSDVPCGSCTACCTSSQFIHISPGETDALAHIPPALLFPSPGLPRGHVVMGYDERGHCPMLIDNACSIYEHRPHTCRAYDCRVFPASGVDLDEANKMQIAERVRRWQFSYADDSARVQHLAVQAAASFITNDIDSLPERSRPANATQRAILAIEIHDDFLDRGERTNIPTLVEAPDTEAIRSTEAIP